MAELLEDRPAVLVLVLNIVYIFEKHQTGPQHGDEVTQTTKGLRGLSGRCVVAPRVRRGLVWVHFAVVFAGSRRNYYVDIIIWWREKWEK